MQHRSIPSKVLLTETLRQSMQFLLLVALFALACTVIYFASGSSKNLPAVVEATFFALMFFAAPLAASSLRAKLGVRLFTNAGGKSLLFCFTWGSFVVAAFIASLQLWQGMGATALNYLEAMGTAGFVCAATATFPSSH